MDRYALRAALAAAKDNDGDCNVRELARKLDDAELFFALYLVAVDSQENGPACPAAMLLLELNPACQLSCEDAVTAMLPEWEISIEEVPFYLIRQFGRQRIEEALDRLSSGFLGRDRKLRLDTIRYWISVNS